MFKKITVIVLCIIMAFSMAACGEKAADTEVVSPTQTSTATPAPVPTPEPTPEPAADSLLSGKYIEDVLNGAIHMETTVIEKNETVLYMSIYTKDGLIVNVNKVPGGPSCTVIPVIINPIT